MDEFSGFIITAVVSLLIAGLGVYQIITGDVRLLHSYHYATTPPADRPKLARITGAALVACGVGCFLLVPTALPDWMPIVGIVILVAGVVVTLAAIIHYNGSLISYGTSASGASSLFGGMSPRMTMAVCGVLGIALSLIGIGPGAYMIATGDVSLLHGYHYVNVSAADLPSLALGEGLCMICLGVAALIGVIASGGIAAYRSARWPKVLLALCGALFAASLIAMLAVIIHYNGSLMG